MTDTEICAVKYSEVTKDYKPIKTTMRKNTFSSINYPAPTAKAIDIFNAMLKSGVGVQETSNTPSPETKG